MVTITRITLAWSAVFCFIVVSFLGGPVFAETYTIGIVSHFEILDSSIEGFKNGMQQLGYIEGRNITYIYSEPIEESLKNVEIQVSKMLAERADILFAAGNVLTDHVIKSVDGNNIPILFAAASLPVEFGLVNSISSPGGNVTGTRLPFTAPKTLEWFLKISPEAKKALVPFNPGDSVSKAILAVLEDRIAGIGIEMVYREVHSVEEACDAIENLPKDIDAVFRIPSPTLDPRNSKLSEAAIKRRIPMISCLPLDDAVLLSFYGDIFQAGQKTARSAHRIFLGAKPSDLPVETSECILAVNLDTAKKIGLYIPDEILMQADKIAR